MHILASSPVYEIWSDIGFPHLRYQLFFTLPRRYKHDVYPFRASDHGTCGSPSPRPSSRGPESLPPHAPKTWGPGLGMQQPESAIHPPRPSAGSLPWMGDEGTSARYPCMSV